MRSQFIGYFKMTTEAGSFFGPLAVGFLARASSLDAATRVVGGLTLAFAFSFALLYREQHRPRASRTASSSAARRAEDRARLVAADSAAECRADVAGCAGFELPAATPAPRSRA